MSSLFRLCCAALCRAGDVLARVWREQPDAAAQQPMPYKKLKVLLSGAASCTACKVPTDMLTHTHTLVVWAVAVLRVLSLQNKHLHGKVRC
jgi:hypothetical protein